MDQPQRTFVTLVLIVGLLLFSSGTHLATNVNSSTPSVFRSLQKETNAVRMNDSYLVQEENQDLPLALNELLDLSKSAENSGPSERLLESKAKWVQTYHSGLAEAHSRPAAQTIDDKGNLFIAGYALNDMESLNSDYLVIKYDANGNLLWSSKFDNKGKIDQPSGICTDRSGNVYVTGWSYVRGAVCCWVFGRL